MSIAPTHVRPKYWTSELSQFVQQHLNGDFHFLDGDEILLRYSAQPITYARETRVLRFLESKHPGEEIRRSQREVLPLLAEILDVAVTQKLVARDSGVFILTGSPPFVDGASVQWVRPSARGMGLSFRADRRLSRRDLEMFIRCRARLDKEGPA